MSTDFDKKIATINAYIAEDAVEAIEEHCYALTIDQVRRLSQAVGQHPLCPRLEKRARFNVKTNTYETGLLQMSETTKALATIIHGLPDIAQPQVAQFLGELIRHEGGDDFERKMLSFVALLVANAYGSPEGLENLRQADDLLNKVKAVLRDMALVDFEEKAKS